MYGWVNRREGEWNDRLAGMEPGRSEGGNGRKMSPTLIENAHCISCNTPFIVGIVLFFLSGVVIRETVIGGGERRQGNRDHRGSQDEGVDNISNQSEG